MAPSTEPTPSERALPFSALWPLAAGVISGLLLRFVFSGVPGSRFTPMGAGFIYLAPMLVGAVTVYVAETSRRRSWGYYFAAPFVANVLFVVGTLLIMIEGLICAILIIPMFAAWGMLGGLLMGMVCRLTNWPRQALYSVSVLPLVVALAGMNQPLPERIRAVERTVIIDAPAEIVWNQIHDMRDIRPEEVGGAWAFRIGVPKPLTGVTTERNGERIRRITMGKQVYFDQVTTQWQENRYVHWTYRFYEDSFPPHALDDHVRIGGHYFDVKDTSYELTPLGATTELRMRMHYRVSTQFNWYADFLATKLLGNVEEALLDLYRRRAEAIRLE